VRRLASGLFLVWRVLWMGLTLLAAARFLAHVTGWSVASLIVLSAAVATAYTAVGGMRAVLWTDAAQFVVLLGAIMAALGVTAERAGGFAAMWSTVRDAGGLAPFVPRDPQFLSWDPRIRITLGSAIIGTFVAFLARYVADQSIVQRYVAAKSLAAARRGFVWNVVGALLSIGMLLVLGVAVHATARRTGIGHGRVAGGHDVEPRLGAPFLHDIAAGRLAHGAGRRTGECARGQVAGGGVGCRLHAAGAGGTGAG
jgi:Na+/proline symporter